MLAITCVGLGRLHPAPGTWGSLPPIVAIGIAMAVGAPGSWVTLAMFVGAVMCSLVCIIYGSEAEARFREKDPSFVVADETAGQCVALIGFPMLHPERVWLLVLAFVAFRVFDVIKPPPARQVQAVAGGWGILLDDLFAGAMALAVVQVAAVLW